MPAPPTTTEASATAIGNVSAQLDEHIRHCVVHATEQGADLDGRVTEAVSAVQRLLRT